MSLSNLNYPKLMHLILDSGMKQYKIAEKAGLTEGRLSKIIHGRAKPTDEEFERLAVVLNASVDQIKSHAS